MTWSAEGSSVCKVEKLNKASRLLAIGTSHFFLGVSSLELCNTIYKNVLYAQKIKIITLKPTFCWHILNNTTETLI